MNLLSDGITCYVYVLKIDFRTYYTGLTNNIDRRLKEHRTKKTGYTSRFKNKELIFVYRLDNRKEARKLEVYIKKIGANRFMIKNENSIKNDSRTIKYNRINTY